MPTRGGGTGALDWWFVEHQALPPATHRRAGWPRAGLILVTLLVTLNAIYGGVGLIVNGMGMPDSWLQRTPFDSWLLPGLALLVTVALPQGVGAVVALRRHPRAATVGLVVGVALVLWILVQLLVLRRYFFLQPVIAGLGVLEVALALAWHRRTAPAGGR